MSNKLVLRSFAATACVVLLLGANYNPRLKATIDVSSLARGGSGTQADPWSGWIDSINALPSGRVVYFPAGYYSHEKSLKPKARWVLRGDGEFLSVLVPDKSLVSSAILVAGPANATTRMCLRIQGIGLVARSPKSKAGIEVIACSQVYIEHVAVSNFRHGVILDQAEVVYIDKCNLEGNAETNLWLANGGTNTANAQGQFTNAIWVADTNFNNAVGVGMHIRDDGGLSHHFANLHVHGGARVGYFSSLQSGSFTNGYTEAQNDTLFQFMHQSIDGKVEGGRCNCFNLSNNLIGGPGMPVNLGVSNWNTINCNLFIGAQKVAITNPFDDGAGSGANTIQGNMVQPGTKLTDAPGAPDVETDKAAK